MVKHVFIWWLCLLIATTAIISLIRHNSDGLREWVHTKYPVSGIPLPVIVVREPNEVEFKKLMGSAMTEEQQPFENQIKEFFLIAKDDIFNGGWYKPHKIDMSARKQFFTNKAWEEYKNFVNTRKEVINYKGQRQEGRFEYGTQKYLEDKNFENFSVDGWAEYWAYDFGISADKFHLDIKYKTDNKDLKKFIINEWNFGITETNEKTVIHCGKNDLSSEMKQLTKEATLKILKRLPS